MLKELFKGSAIYGIAPFVPKILSVLLLPILTRYLTSTDYGIIGTITSITFAVQALQDLGIRVLLPNYFYKCRCQYKVVWREIYGFLSFWMIVFAVIQAFLLYIFIPVEAQQNIWWIIILGNFSTVFFGPTAMIGQMYYQLNLKPTPVAVRVVLSGVVTILTNFICVVVFKWGYMGAYVGSFAGTFIANLTYWPVVNFKLKLSPIYSFKWQTVTKILKVSIPTIPHYYSAYLMNSSNVVAMNFYNRPQAEIGKLTMAQSINAMFDTLINAINQVFGPLSYQYIRDDNKGEMKRLLFTYLLMAYTFTFLYSLWSREVYDILISNDELAATYKYSIILVMALNYRPIYVYCVNYFFYYENTIKVLGITFMAGIVSCLFYFSATPFLGVYAALIGFYLGCVYMGYCGYFYYFYKSHTIYHIKWYLFAILQVVLTFGVYYCVDLSLLYKLLISIVFLIIIGSIFIFKVIDGKKDIKKGILFHFGS